MRSNVTVEMPNLHLLPGKSILDFDGFHKTMKMLDPIAEKEIDQSYERHSFIKKRFIKTHDNRIKISYLYNTGARRVESSRMDAMRQSIRSFNSNYNSYNDSSHQYWGLDLGTTTDSFTTYVTGSYTV